MKLVEELDYQFDFKKLKNECPVISKNAFGKKLNGVSIQHRKNVPLPFNAIDGLVSLDYYDKDCTYEDFNIVHENFKNTEYERIINDFNLVRSRVLLLHGKTCYTFHRDESWRLHIPIKTNPNCLIYFLDHKEHFHLEEGKIYTVNANERHTAINGSSEDRIHFVGCLRQNI